MNHLLAFFGGDPLVAWLLTGALCVLIAAVAVAVNTVLDRRHRRRDAKRRALLERIVKATAPDPVPVRWPMPSGPKGWKRSA